MSNLVIIPVTNDAYGQEPGETLIGSEADVRVMVPRINWEHVDPTWIAYFDCPLGSLPDDAVIVSAKLQLAFTESHVEEHVIAGRVTEAWTESSELCPTYDSGYDYPPTPLYGSPGWTYWGLTFDLTVLVQQWWSGAQSNYGVCIYGGTVWHNGDPIKIASHESGSAPPYWEIEYSTEGGGPGGDTTDPVVSITSPDDAAEVSGTVTFIATATDNVAVTSVRCYVDGQAVGDVLTAPNHGAAYSWSWDSCPWANGEHTVEVKAWDAVGNMGSDSITVDLQNSLAASQVKLLTEPLTPAQGRGADLAICTLDVTPPPVNPAKVYNVRAFCGPDSTDEDDFFPVEPNRSHGFPEQWTAVRWMLLADPAEVLSYYETGDTSIVALCEYPTALAAVLTDAPALMSFDGSELTELLDLSDWGTTARDVCYADGKLLVALDDRVVAYDLDAGEAVLDIGLPGVTAVRAIEPRGTTGAWIAGDISGGGRLFSFSYPTTEALGDVEQILSLEAYETAVAIGCAGGKVYASSGGTPALAYASGEANVLSMHYLSGQMLAGTSTDGVIYRAQPAWAQDADLLYGAVNALGQYQGKAYAGGDDAELWRRDAADTWAQDRELDEATAINALLEYTDASGAVSLLIGTTGTDARLYRLELSPGSRVQSGVGRPDMVGKMLRTVEV